MIGVSSPSLDDQRPWSTWGPPTSRPDPGRERLRQGAGGHGPSMSSSDRAGRNFVPVDCCTLQENLFESELFGHEKGAFTGADRRKRGPDRGGRGRHPVPRRDRRDRPPIQAKLLRFLETGVFRRVGGTKDLQANVRVVAATNRDLEAMSEAGQFRSDLYYRLSTFVIDVPPLRVRRDDIPYLAAPFHPEPQLLPPISKRISGDAIRAPDRLRLARQCARAQERHRAGHHPIPRQQHHPPGTPDVRGRWAGKATRRSP